MAQSEGAYFALMRTTTLCQMEHGCREKVASDMRNNPENAAPRKARRIE